jgi:HD-like signal output (HDOD) protein/CheY-like chemotaxis protein
LVRKILFISDEPNISSEFGSLLPDMRKPWDINVADNGPDVLRLLEETEFDVIVADMDITGLDLTKLLTWIRQKNPQAVRIVMAAMSAPKAILPGVRLAHQYVSKPCDTDLFMATIERAVALKRLLREKKLRRLISSIESFPGLPASYARITELLCDSETSLNEVAKVIGEDLGMTVKILQIVNSAFYGIARRLTSPEEAVVILGLDTIRALVLTIGLFSGFEKSGIPKRMVEELYSHSLKTGSLARTIAKKEHFDKDQVEHAFLAGLLHDLGKLVMAHNMPRKYLKLLQVSLHKKLPIRDTENEIFGATHEQIGAYLIGLWGLPHSVVETVAFHHDPLPCPTIAFDPLGAVHVADALAHISSQSGGDIQENRLSMPYLERFGLISHLDDWIDLALEWDS